MKRMLWVAVGLACSASALAGVTVSVGHCHPYVVEKVREQVPCPAAAARRPCRPAFGYLPAFVWLRRAGPAVHVLVDHLEGQQVDAVGPAAADVRLRDFPLQIDRGGRVVGPQVRRHEEPQPEEGGDGVLDAHAVAQGQLQGVLASLVSLTAVFGPVIFSWIYFWTPGWPGFIWLVAAILYVFTAPLLLAVPGVAHAIVFGGDVRQIQILPDPGRLASFGVTLTEVSDAARAALALRGAGFIDLATQRVLLDAPAPEPDVQAIGQAVITLRNGVPLRIADLAEVKSRLGGHGASARAAVAVREELARVRPDIDRPGATM